MVSNHHLQTYEIMHSSIAEKNIGEDVVLVLLEIAELGELSGYLWAETDHQGNRKVRGVVEIQGKRYECVLGQSVSPYSALLIMPLDDGSYNNMNMAGEGEQE